MDGWRVLVMMLLSGAIHVSPAIVGAIARGGAAAPLLATTFLTPDVRAAGERPPTTEAELVVKRSPEAIAADRKALVAWGRKARQEGRLELGEFLLRAATIDAEEAGYLLDIDEARRRYQAAVAVVRERKHDPSLYVSSLLRLAYGSLHYQSIGGTMADALLEGGGSCEQISHLLAATLHDVGLGRYTFLRYYGGGTAHLAPVYRYPGYDELDLMTGGPPARGGTRFPAAELVEIYARGHGLADGPVDSSSGADQWSDGRPSFAGGYPPNDDDFEGIVPVYAEQAIGGAGASGSATSADDGLEDWYLESSCMIAEARLYIDRVDISVIGADADAEPYRVSWLEAPGRGSVAWKARRIARAEKKLPSVKHDADRVISQVCLALGYDELASDFVLLSQPQLSKASSKRAMSLISRAKTAMEETHWDAESRKPIKDNNSAWVLSLVEGGKEILLASLEDAVDEQTDSEELFAYHAGWRGTMVSLLDDDVTRERTLAAIHKARGFQQYVWAGQLALVDNAERVMAKLPQDATFVQGVRALQRLETMLDSGAYDDQRQENVMALLADAGFPEAWLTDFGKRFGDADYD